jgi:hypothetical protein
MNAPNPPAPDQSRHNIGSRGQGKLQYGRECINNDVGEAEAQKEDRGKDPGNMACKQCEAGNQRIKEKGADQEPHKYNPFNEGRACPGRVHPVPATLACSPTCRPCRQSEDNSVSEGHCQMRKEGD